MLIKITTTKHRVTYINPAHIIIIDQSPVDPTEICMVIGQATIWISAVEFARILPLLSGDAPAPVAASDVNSDHLALLDEYGGVLRGWLADMKTMDGQKRASQLRDEILNAMRKDGHVLPMDVISASRDLQSVLDDTWSMEELYDAAAKLNASIMPFIPEETVSDD